MPKSLSASDRLNLSRLLSGLPGSQFNELITAILPPPGVVSSPSAPQGNRVYEVLQWLGSPTGEDYFNDFLEALEIIAPGKFQPSQPAPTSEPQAVATPSQPDPIPQSPPAQPIQTATPTPATPPEPTTKDFQVDLGGGVTLDMVYISGGRFWMGSPDNELGRLKNEEPQHKVTISAFYMGRYPVTQSQWRAVSLLDDVDRILSHSPSNFSGDDLPVEQVNWHEAAEFCQRLSRKYGYIFRLPSEAEWEYACRAQSATPFHLGDTVSTDQANYNGNYNYANGKKGKYRETTTSVNSFSANQFGIFDIHGNVWEWCQDVWHDSYEGAPTDGSAWVIGGEQMLRVRRGGSWCCNPMFCRSAYRGRDEAEEREYNFGFRVCCSVPRT